MKFRIKGLHLKRFMYIFWMLWTSWWWARRRKTLSGCFSSATLSRINTHDMCINIHNICVYFDFVAWELMNRFFLIRKTSVRFYILSWSSNFHFVYVDLNSIYFSFIFCATQWRVSTIYECSVWRCNKKRRWVL